MAEAPPSLAIKEANVHLQALHERNVSLEKEVQQLRALVSVTKEQEERLKGQSQIIIEKDSTIKQQDNKIRRLQENVENLAREVSKKNLVINQHAQKVKVLADVMKYKSALNSISKSLNLLEENFIVDVDNMAQVNMADGQSIDMQKLKDLDLETSL